MAKVSHSNPELDNVLGQHTHVVATLFVPPRGERREIEIRNVNPEDAQYINENNIKVSLEDLMIGGEAIYFDDGRHLDDDESEDPDEVIILSHGRKSCEECFAEGVAILKARVNDGRPIF